MDPTMEPEQQVVESWQFGKIQYWHPPGICGSLLTIDNFLGR
jgi:hypothetical protein